MENVLREEGMGIRKKLQKCVSFLSKPSIDSRDYVAWEGRGEKGLSIYLIFKNAMFV